MRRSTGPLVTLSVTAALLATLIDPAAASPDHGGTTPGKPPDVEVRELGNAVTSVNVRAGDFGTWTDGRPVLYATSNGDPVTFNVIDVATGASLDSAEIPGEFVAGSVHQSPDGSVYFNTNDPTPGALWRYVPGAGVQHLGDRVAGEVWLRDVDTDASGTAYISTYPNAKLLAYHPDTGAIRDYGSLVDDATYAYAVEVVGEEVWVGTGPVAHLLAVNPETGAVREIPLPEEHLDNLDYVIGIDVHDGKVYVRVSPRGRFDTLVYDLATATWTDLVPGTSAAGFTAPDAEGTVYLLQGRSAVSYDPATGEVAPFGLEQTELAGYLEAATGTYAVGLIDLGGEKTFAAMTNKGDLLTYGLTSGSATAVAADITRSAVDVVGFGVGPDGNVYAGAKIGAGVMGRIVQGTHELQTLSGPSQAEGVGSHHGKIVIGDYSGAGVNVGDLSQPWQWGTNPKQVIKLNRGDPYHQDRVWAVQSVGDRVALGTIPEPGQNGGSVTLLDTETAEFEVFRHVVQDQSVVSLTYRDGLLYGGTSIHGGSGTTPVAKQAELFIFDPTTERVVWHGSPVPGADVVNGLTWTPDGHLWGITEHGTVFEFDVARRKTVRTRQVIDPPANMHPWGNHTSLVYDEQADGFFGTAGWELFFLDRKSLRSQKHRVGRDTHRVVKAGNGDVYCVGTTDVCVIERAGED